VAWTFDGVVAEGGTKATGSTIVVNPDSSIASGKILVAYCASKEYTHSTVTDSQSNTWTKLDQAGTYLTVSIWMCKVGSALSTSDTITLTVGGSNLARTIQVAQFSLPSGKTFGYIDSDKDDGFGDNGLAALSGLSSSEHLYLGMIAWGYTAPVVEEPDGYTLTGVGTAGSPLGSNIVGMAGHKITSSTSETFDAVWAAEAAWGVLLVAVDEISD
jgi:hypothetical protein